MQMKVRYIILLLWVLMAGAVGASAEHSQTRKLYMFGMAASFSDTIVHFTPVKEVDGAWMDKKGRFLLGRQEYSYQLRDYLAGQLGMPQRTCLVFYEKSRKKAEKKYAKMIRLYSRPAKNGHQYDVRHVDSGDFNFSAVDMSVALEQEEQSIEEQKTVRKLEMKDGKKKRKGKTHRKGGMSLRGM